jgi:hypothetical protein
MNLDFSQFKAVEVSNKKNPNALPSKVQEFDDLKFRKAESKKDGVGSKFFISNARFAELNLTEFALRHFVHPQDKNVILLAVVADDDGKFLRKRTDKKTGEAKEKGGQFKSEALEAALVAAGVLDAAAELGSNQFIKMTQVAKDVTIDGYACRIVFTLAKGAKKESAKDTASKEKEVVATKEVAAPVAATNAPAAPVADVQSAPQAAPVADEWN